MSRQDRLWMRSSIARVKAAAAAMRRNAAESRPIAPAKARPAARAEVAGEP